MSPAPVGRQSADRRQAPAALDLIEAAVALLREAPTGVLGLYYLGSLPCVLVFLFFWAEMSGSPDAAVRCGPAAFGVALAFTWMKTFQMIFARRLWGVLTGEPEERQGASGWFRAVSCQLGWHALGLWLLPAALVATLPFAWVVAFLQNVTVLGGRPGQGSLGRRAGLQAQLWPAQNHVLLLFLGLFGALVVIDVAVGLVWVPRLLKTFFGIETAFSRSSWPFLNSTFVAVCLAIGYLCLDPVLKAAFVMRCFHGEGRRGGDDLRRRLRRCQQARASSTKAVLVLLAALVAWCATPTRADADPSVDRPPAAGTVEPAELDRAIEGVLAGPEFRWREPRSDLAPPPESQGFWESFARGTVDTVEGWMRAGGRGVRRAWEWLAEWLMRRFRSNPALPKPVGMDWMAWPQMLVFLLLVGVAYVLVFAVLRLRLRRRAAAAAELVPITGLPDLTDESVTASQLPEEEWARMAREQAGRGEWRLALRALYLAGLAHLAARGWVALERHKSNRDYERELGRRARGAPELEAAFVRNGGRFDRVWYGRHAADAALFAEFTADWERIQSC